MKRILRTILFLLLTIIISAPRITFAAEEAQYVWSRTLGGAFNDTIVAVDVDSIGNTYILGRFSGTDTDLDMTDGTDLFTPNGNVDIFISKYAADGSYEWTRTVAGSGNDTASDLVVDDNDNVFFTGSFLGTDIDFDPSGAEDLHSSNGFGDIFVTKYESDGSYGWTRTAGGTSIDDGLAVAVDGDGNVYLTGRYSGTDVDFDGTAGEDLETSNGAQDFFIQKYFADGSYGWTHSIGGTNADQGLGIGVDGDDNVYVSGYFNATDLDFDPSGAEDLFTTNGGNDVFITKYATDGSYVWTETFGGASNDNGSITVHSDGSLYVYGIFQGTDVDLDPTGTENLHSSSGSTDIFFSSLNSDGSFNWSRTIGGASADSAISLNIDDDGDLNITGFFQGTNVDFDASSGVDTYSSNGGQDVFFTKYTAAGAYVWTRVFGGSGADIGDGIVTYGDTIYVSGYFSGSNVDLDASSGTDLHSASANQDAFLSKYVLAEVADPVVEDESMSTQSSSDNDPDFSAVTSVGETMAHNVTAQTPTLLREAKRYIGSLRTPTVKTQASKQLRLTSNVPDTDRLQSITLRVFGKTYTFKPTDSKGIFFGNVTVPNKDGSYPYTLVLNYGSVTLSEKGVFEVGKDTNSTNLLFLNSLFREVHGRNPSFDEWTYWALRILAGEKGSLPEILGAIQWQKLHGN